MKYLILSITLASLNAFACWSPKPFSGEFIMRLRGASRVIFTKEIQLKKSDQSESLIFSIRSPQFLGYRYDWLSLWTDFDGSESYIISAGSVWEISKVESALPGVSATLTSNAGKKIGISAEQGHGGTSLANQLGIQYCL